MTEDPLPDTPAHQVLLDVAFGDHQVTDYQADVEARTIGAAAHEPTSSRVVGRTPKSCGTSPRSITTPTRARQPTTGTSARSRKALKARANSSAPNRRRHENLPNRTGQDPHGAPREAPAEQQLVSDFFNGAILKGDNCGGGPCYAGSFTGP